MTISIKAAACRSGSRLCAQAAARRTHKRLSELLFAVR